MPALCSASSVTRRSRATTIWTPSPSRPRPSSSSRSGGNVESVGSGIRWAICRPEAPEELLGTCGFNLWVQNSARAVLGFDLARANWRQGIMSEALGLLLDYGFQQMELNRVEAVVFRDNDASCRLLAKLGFAREGLLREYEYLHGRLQDMYMYSLLRRDREA